MTSNYPFTPGDNYVDDPLSAQAWFTESATSITAPELPLVPPRRLYAIGDIHLSYKSNRDALDDLRPHPNDGLILVGDMGESVDHLGLSFAKATSLFAQVFWYALNAFRLWILYERVDS
jgi:hypothetical protein